MSYEFLWMHASGDQLRQIAALVDQGVLRPVVGEVRGFDDTPQAVAGLGSRPVRGKAVIEIARSAATTDDIADNRAGQV